MFWLPYHERNFVLFFSYCYYFLTLSLKRALIFILTLSFYRICWLGIFLFNNSSSEESTSLQTNSMLNSVMIVRQWRINSKGLIRWCIDIRSATKGYDHERDHKNSIITRFCYTRWYACVHVCNEFCTGL